MLHNVHAHSDNPYEYSGYGESSAVIDDYPCNPDAISEHVPARGANVVDSLMSSLVHKYVSHPYVLTA